MHELKSRDIPRSQERELWARAAGRCEFQGCNRLLYKSSVTQESINASQRAHIYSFSPQGPRGQGPYKGNPEQINELDNLLLVCHPCHQTIDPENKVEKYHADLLLAWKHEHEKRIEIVTGIDPVKKSHVVLYGANIGAEYSPLDYVQCAQAMFPRRYPAEQRPVRLSLSSALRDHEPEYWQSEAAHLRRAFQQGIVPLVKDDGCRHFSIFALATQPLLILLGSLFTDKIQTDVYQLHREPEPGWGWHEPPDGHDFIITPPDHFDHPPVLLLALSDHVSRDRITAVTGDSVSIWELKVTNPHNDFLKSRAQLSAFREAVRKLMVDIKQKHGRAVPLRIFPVMPISCCIELGRARMPQADMPWIIYNQSNVKNCFIETIEIIGDEHDKQ